MWKVIPGKFWAITYQLVQSGLQGQVSLVSSAVMNICIAHMPGELIPKEPCHERTAPCTRGWGRVAGASITNIIPATVALCSLLFLLGQKNCYPNYFLFLQTTLFWTQIRQVSCSALRVLLSTGSSSTHDTQPVPAVAFLSTAGKMNIFTLHLSSTQPSSALLHHSQGSY